MKVRTGTLAEHSSLLKGLHKQNVNNNPSTEGNSSVNNYAKGDGHGGLTSGFLP